MGRLAILEPLTAASVVASRGTGANNLATPDPKEAWVGTAEAGATTFSVDLGVVRQVDTIYLGAIAPVGAVTWSITGGISSQGDAVILPTTAVAGSDALWSGAARSIRYLAVTLDRTAGVASAGILAIGAAFVAALGQEWGAGRRPIDTGTATPLLGGGFSTVEGVRKRAFEWTFGDLTSAEVDQLEAIAMARGVTKPVLVVQYGAAAPLCLWGLFRSWKAFERRNRVQTRWELGIEQWV